MLRRGLFIGTICAAFFASGWFVSEANRYEPVCKVTVRPQGTETTWYFHSPETCLRKKCDVIKSRDDGVCVFSTPLAGDMVESKCISHTGEGAQLCSAGQ